MDLYEFREKKNKIRDLLIFSFFFERGMGMSAWHLSYVCILLYFTLLRTFCAAVRHFNDR